MFLVTKQSSGYQRDSTTRDPAASRRFETVRDDSMRTWPYCDQQKTSTGWLLSGPGGESVRNATVSNVVITGECADYPFYTNEHDQQVNTLKDFWET